MGGYLFNQSIVIIFSALTSLLCFLFLKRSIKAKLSLKKLILGIVVSGALLVVEILLVSHIFGLNNTPFAGYYLIFICDLLLVFSILQWRNRRKALIFGLAAFLSALLLLLLSVNDFYQYFPTLGAVFGSPINANSALADTTTRQHGGYRITSIESRLFRHGQRIGKVIRVNMPGTQSHLPARDGYIYLPPAYLNKSFDKVRFPVVVLLTGVPGSPSSWLQSGLLVNTMNSFASHHAGITPLIVIADQSGSFTNDTECLNSANGNAETYLTVDVPNYVEQHYRVSGNPVNWGIGGFSEGGMCAAMLTLNHQDVYRHFLDMSGDPNPYLNDTSQTLPVLFHGSKKAQQEHNIDWLLRNKQIEPHLTAQFAIGANDSSKLIREMKDSYRTAKERHIPVSFEIIANQGHDFGAWSQGFNDALPLLSYYLGATECQTICSQE